MFEIFSVNIFSSNRRLTIISRYKRNLNAIPNLLPFFRILFLIYCHFLGFYSLFIAFLLFSRPSKSWKLPFDKAFDQNESIKNDWIISQLINNLAFQLVFFGKKRELFRLGNLRGIAILYFFALMQKSNKKNQACE